MTNAQAKSVDSTTATQNNVVSNFAATQTSYSSDDLYVKQNAGYVVYSSVSESNVQKLINFNRTNPTTSYSVFNNFVISNNILTSSQMNTVGNALYKMTMDYCTQHTDKGYGVVLFRGAEKPNVIAMVPND